MLLLMSSLTAFCVHLFFCECLVSLTIKLLNYAISSLVAGFA